MLLPTLISCSSLNLLAIKAIKMDDKRVGNSKGGERYVECVLGELKKKRAMYLF